MTRRNQSVGSQGDAEYHTTLHVEYAEFYASSTTIRDVTTTRSTDSMVGFRTCVYGRDSNNRRCDHFVQSVSETINIDGIIVSSMASTDNLTTDNGDSGAGWSYSTTAWGVHSSVSYALVESYFTPIRRVESALGVNVLEK